MNILVKPEHLRDNSYFNTANEHSCPLGRALEPLFAKTDIKYWVVGQSQVKSYDENKNETIHYNIDPNWNVKTVTGYIYNANEGSDVEYLVELEDVNPIIV
jgi:hypothetical protein